MSPKFINFLLFQLGWLACVLLGGSVWHGFAPLLVAAILVWHLRISEQPQSFMQLILFALGLGLVWENLLTLSGLVVYTQGQLVGNLAPVWILSMWALLATTPNLSFAWLQQRPRLMVVFGAIGGPMAFIAGERLGAATFPQPIVTLSVLALGWAVLFPILMYRAQRVAAPLTPRTEMI